METFICDQHVLIFSLLKTTFIKMSQNKLQYRNYKQFEATGKRYKTGKRFLEYVKQIRSFQNENDLIN